MPATSRYGVAERNDRVESPRKLVHLNKTSSIPSDALP
jgi:hypothetical protein